MFSILLKLLLLTASAWADKHNEVSASHPTAVEGVTEKDCAEGNWVFYSPKINQDGLFPETNVVYMRYLFKVKPNEKINLKIQGQFPNARYMGFTLYDSDSMESISGIADQEIIPKSGKNPFSNSGLNHSDSGSYQLNLNSDSCKENCLSLSSERRIKERKLELWYRVYLPKESIDTISEQGKVTVLGGVSLPKIVTSKDEKGQFICPETFTKEIPKTFLNKSTTFREQLKNRPPKPTLKNNQPMFVYFAGNHLYPNKHTVYLVSTLPKESNGTVSVFRIKVPTTPGDITKNVGVRYWSLCLGNNLSTQTIANCLNDLNSKIDSEGFLNLVVGPESMRAATEKKGMNFIGIPKGTAFPVLIYRHLLPEAGAESNFTKLTLWPPKELRDFEEVEEVQGTFLESVKEKYLSESVSLMGDFYPLGKSLSLEEFIKP